MNKEHRQNTSAPLKKCAAATRNTDKRSSFDIAARLEPTRYATRTNPGGAAFKRGRG